MNEGLPNLAAGQRRDEDIALDLMKFISANTGVGKHGSPVTGFTSGAAPKAEDYVNQLLTLYAQCLGVVKGKK